MADQSKYRDVKFFLIAIALISAFNYYLTYKNISFGWFLVLTYLADTIQGWLGWWTARWIIIYLDKKLPYGGRPAKRILVQVLLTTVAGLLVIALLTELVSWIVKGQRLPAQFYLFDIFIICIWFFVINGIYIGMHYYSEWNHSELQRRQEKKVRLDGFNVKQGNQQLQILFDDILGFYSDDGYSVMLSRENKRYFPDKSLDKIELMLPSEFFFRLNRQYIVHRKAITGFKRIEDGRLEVFTKGFEHLPKVIPLSRLRASSFKSWFQLPETES